MRRAAFLDRDGTIIHDADYLATPDEVVLLPGAARAVRMLNAAGVLVVVITNQSAIARGIITEEALETIHDRLRSDLAAEGAHLDDIRFCPHLADGVVTRYARACDCRKPEPGMILRAARQHVIDLASSVAVGDAERDVEAGRRAGCRTVFLLRGRTLDHEPPADFVADDLLAAVRWFLSLGE